MVLLIFNDADWWYFLGICLFVTTVRICRYPHLEMYYSAQKCHTMNLRQHFGHPRTEVASASVLTSSHLSQEGGARIKAWMICCGAEASVGDDLLKEMKLV